MKKLLATMLLLLLLFAVGCAAAVEPSDVTGMWYLNLVERNGMTFGPDDVGVNVAIDLHEDGTAALIASGEEQAGTWTMEDSIIRVTDPSGSVMALMAGEEELIFIKQDTKMGFGRVSARHERPVSMWADEVSQFVGEWVSSFVYTDTTFTYTDELGLEMKLSIDENGITEITDTGDGQYWPCGVAGGWLVGVDYTGSPAILIALNEDGTISVYNPDGSLCFVRAE